MHIHNYGNENIDYLESYKTTNVSKYIYDKHFNIKYSYNNNIRSNNSLTCYVKRYNMWNREHIIDIINPIIEKCSNELYKSHIKNQHLDIPLIKIHEYREQLYSNIYNNYNYTYYIVKYYIITAQPIPIPDCL
jgi:hypothetical protein